jgi:hypothetical protein
VHGQGRAYNDVVDGGVRWRCSHVAISSWLHVPAAMARTACSASSTVGVVCHVQSLIVMNKRNATQAARLLPSGSGWFFARCTERTAAFSVKSG